MGLDVADMQKSISANTKVHEDGLDAGLKIYDFPFVNIADVVVLAGSFDIEFFKSAIFDDCNAAFFRLRRID